MEPNEFYVQANFDFVADNVDELSFHAGDTLIVTSTSTGNGWWQAKTLSGQVGIIPANYVEALPTNEQSTSETMGFTEKKYEEENNSFASNNSMSTTHNSEPLVTESVLLPTLTTNTVNPIIHAQTSLNSSFDSDTLPVSSYTSPLNNQPETPYIQVEDTIDFNHTNFMPNSQPDPWFQDPNMGLTSYASPFAQPTSPPVSSLDFLPSSSNYQQPISSYDIFSSPSVYETPLPIVNAPVNEPVISPTVNEQNSKDTNTSPVLSKTNTESKEPQKPVTSDPKRFFTLRRQKTNKDTAQQRLSIDVSSEQMLRTTQDDNAGESLTASTSSTKSANSPIENSTETKSTLKTRFFDKHGIDNYLVHGSKLKLSEQFHISYSERFGGPFWAPNPNMPPFTCKIEDPSKGTKIGGLKSFMEYKIHPQIPGGRVVGRRYKQFDWLYEQLLAKFRFICIPLLPGKQIAGRFEQEFVEGRRRQLEIWLNHVCNHPVLCSSFAVQHFVTCELTENDNKDWKAGKRKVEKDEFRGSLWLHCITFEESNLTETQFLSKVDAFNQQHPALDMHLKALHQGLGKYLERHTEIYERDIQRVAELFAKFQSAVQADTTTFGNNELSNSILKISNSYNCIANLYKSEASEGIREFIERIQDYIGFLTCFPLILSIQRSGAEFMRNVQQRSSAGEFSDVMQRYQVLNHVVLAEINYFQKQKVHDFNLYMKALLNDQIVFYEKITTQLREAAASFN